MIDLTKENFEEEVLKARGYVLVNFYGEHHQGQTACHCPEGAGTACDCYLQGWGND